MSANSLKYSRSVTQSHPFYNCFAQHVLTINELMQKNWGQGVLFGTDFAFSMDDIEKELAPSDKLKRLTPGPSVDLAFGVSNNSESLFLLAELKIDVKSRRGRRINKTELLNKYEQSKYRITNFADVVVSPLYPIVLGVHDQTEAQRRKINQWGLENNGSLKDRTFLPMTEQEFYNQFWS